MPRPSRFACTVFAKRVSWDTCKHHWTVQCVICRWEFSWLYIWLILCNMPEIGWFVSIAHLNIVNLIACLCISLSNKCLHIANRFTSRTRSRAFERITLYKISFTRLFRVFTQRKWSKEGFFTRNILKKVFFRPIRAIVSTLFKSCVWSNQFFFQLSEQEGDQKNTSSALWIMFHFR